MNRSSNDRWPQLARGTTSEAAVRAGQHFFGLMGFDETAADKGAQEALAHVGLKRLDRCYNWSLYEATIVAAAGLSGCAILCSEDMQYGCNIKLPESAGGATLTIRNPFRA